MRKLIPLLFLVLAWASPGWSQTLTITPTVTPTSTALPTWFPTPNSSCLSYVPTGPGGLTQNLKSGCTSNYICAQVNDGNTSYVFSGGSTKYDSYSVTVPSRSETITSVNVHVFSRAQFVTGDVTALLRINSNTYLNPAGSFSADANSYKETTYAALTNPATNSSWAWSDLAAIEIGVAQSTTGVDQIRTTQVFMEVCWGTLPNTPTVTPTSPPANTPTQTPTFTPFFANTNTPTPSRTRTPTPTITSTPGNTNTPIPTNTASAADTPTCGPLKDKRGIPSNSLCNSTRATGTPGADGTPVPAAEEPYGRLKTMSCQGSGTIQVECYPHALPETTPGTWPGVSPWWSTPIPVGTPVACPNFVSFTDTFDWCFCHETTGATGLTCNIDRIPDATMPQGF